MIDFSKLKSLVIPEGVVTKIVSAGVTLWQAVRYKNWVLLSTDVDGSIYNKVGYKDNSRLNSSAAVVDLAGYVVTGYIPAKAGDTIRVKGIQWDSTTNTGGYFYTFDVDYNGLKYKRPNGDGSIDINFTVDENGVVTFTLVSYNTNVSFIRFSAYGVGENLIVTVNEEIV